MRLSVAVIAAACSLAAAQSQADVYMLQSGPVPQHDTPPQLQRQLARLILQQRLGVDDFFSSANELASLSSSDEAVSYLNTYGRPEAALFSERDAAEPSQLLVILEGLESGQMMEAMPGQDKAFVIDNIPSSAATRNLVESEFGLAGVEANACPFERATNPLDKGCWSGPSSIIHVDAKKDQAIVETFQKAISTLSRFAETGEMETTILLFPESSRNSRVNSWSSHPVELRQRQSNDSAGASADSDSPASPAPTEVFPGLAERGSIPTCFQSYNACVTATANCSGHGLCEDTWATKDEDGNKVPAKDGKDACFSCQCKRTRDENNRTTTSWAGATCQKVDVSTPFALFVGFTIFMLATITAAIKLLYSVGDQPLPGVLSAGVMRKPA